MIITVRCGSSDAFCAFVAAARREKLVWASQTEAFQSLSFNIFKKNKKKIQKEEEGQVTICVWHRILPFTPITHDCAVHGPQTSLHFLEQLTVLQCPILCSKSIEIVQWSWHKLSPSFSKVTTRFLVRTLKAAQLWRGKTDFYAFNSLEKLTHRLTSRHWRPGANCARLFFFFFKLRQHLARRASPPMCALTHFLSLWDFRSADWRSSWTHRKPCARLISFFFPLCASPLPNFS